MPLFRKTFESGWPISTVRKRGDSRIPRPHAQVHLRHRNGFYNIIAVLRLTGSFYAAEEGRIGIDKIDNLSMPQEFVPENS